MKKTKLVVLAAIVVAVVAFFALGGQHYLSFEYVKGQQAAIDAWYASNPVATATLKISNTVNASTTRLYYTLDGSDPRLTLGALNPAANFVSTFPTWSRARLKKL